MLLVSPRLLAAIAAMGCLSLSSFSQVPSIPASTPDASTLQTAIASAQHGDEPHALALVEGSLAHHPASLPALRLEAMLLEDLGRNADANAAYAKALQLAPKDPELLLRVGTADLLSHQLEAAITHLTARTRLVARDEEGNYYLAQAYHLKGNNEQALAAIRKALAAAPNDPAIQQKLGELLCSAGEYADALPWLHKAQAADPKLPRLNFDLAVASYDSMDLNAAADFAAAQAQAQPGDLDNLMLLASIQVKLARWGDAESNLQRILAAHPTDAQATLELGHCQLEQKDYATAIATLQHSLALDPTQALPHYLLSRAYTATGDTAEAQHEAGLHREMMQHIAVAMPRAVAQQGADISERARALLKAGNEPAALHLFESTMKGPFVTRGSAWMFLGATYLSLGDTGAAERTLRHALALDPKTHGANTYLGVLALQGGNLSQAETSFQAELAVDPNQPLALGELGEVRYRQGRWAEAVDLLTRSTTTVPSLLYMLCDAEFHLGKPQAADLTAETLVSLSKGEPSIRASLNNLLQANGQAELAARLTSVSAQP